MVVIGLTGSIGMGKSTTAQMFRDEGLPVLDADEIVHALYNGAAAAPVESAFPGVSVGGSIDRERLRARVLDDSDALKRLESIVHPLVAERRRGFLAEARAKHEQFVVLDIPLLFETGLDREVDKIVVVSASEAVQKARVLARPGMTEAQLSSILAKQMPDAEKRRRADWVVDTDAGISAARAQVRAVMSEVQKRRPDA